MENVIRKSIVLRSNLKKGQVNYKPCPSNELQNFTCLSIGSISTVTKQDIDISCTVSSNFITSQRFNENSQIETFKMPLQSFLINSKKYQLSRFNFAWFFFNSRSEQLIFTFKDPDQKLFKKDIDIALIVNLK